ncbi:MAG: 50S ribosomal protein L13, partial [Clostridiales bacterium]|nr:50S ribosomal protein L13 [Clostridiales bacterium]
NHSQYVGGLKEKTLRELLDKKPTDVITLSVKGMLPKGTLGRAMAKKLFVYTGSEHKHQAQNPEVLEVKY